MNAYVQSLFFCILLSSSLRANYQLSETDSIKRKRAVFYLSGATYSVSYIGLYQLWYKNYEQSSFHFFNDSKEWMQMDKAGHTFSAFQLANFQTEAFKWYGLSHNKAVITASAISFLYLSSIEIFDGFSDGWGASLSDLAANLLGSGLFLTQNLYLENITITLKYSYNFNSNLNVRTDILGKSYAEKFLKDYNAQTYWLSFNFNKNHSKNKLLKYLNPAIGYGAGGMTGGLENLPTYENYARKRQFYLALDLDLSKVNTNIKWLDFIIHHINFLKFPMPTIEYSDKNLKFYPVYF